MLCEYIGAIYIYFRRNIFVIGSIGFSSLFMIQSVHEIYSVAILLKLASKNEWSNLLKFDFQDHFDTWKKKRTEKKTKHDIKF